MTLKTQENLFMKSLEGMTMRQWYKGQAIRGLVADVQFSTTAIIKMASIVADEAVAEDKEHEAKEEK